MEALWKDVLVSINKRVNPSVVGAWLSQISFIDYDDDTIFLGVPSRFARDWINDHGLKDIIQQEFSSICSKEVKIVFRVISNKIDSPSSEESNSSSKTNLPILPTRDFGLNPRYRFEDFVTGPSNQLAYAAAVSVAEKPASNYNPLFIYGSAGLGKTHLLNAIGYRILERRPNFKVIYVSTETFMNELINSIRSDSTEKFRNKYRSLCDVLLIDDIQFISNKMRTQDEFFHTFNTLYESHRQIVITSDSYPQEIPELEERLRSRFQWGLIADIQVPEVETRVAILHKKAELEGLDIQDDVAFYIASLVKSNIREIEGSLKRLRAISEMNGRPIDLEFAKQVLQDTVGVCRQISIDDVAKAVSAHFNIKLSDLRSGRRLRIFSRPRQIAMYICRTCLGSSFPNIARFFNKDHSSVICAVKNIEKVMKNDYSTRDSIESIKRQIGL